MEGKQSNDFKWNWLLVLLPWTKTSKGYRLALKSKIRELEIEKLKDHEIEIYDLRTKQIENINHTSAALLTLLTLLWGLLPHFINFSGVFSFVNLGLHGGDLSWGEDIWLFFVPGVASTLVHNLPKFIPMKKGKLLINVVIKFIPFLIVLYWIIRKELQIHEIKKEWKENERSRNQKNKFKRITIENRNTGDVAIEQGPNSDDIQGEL